MTLWLQLAPEKVPPALLQLLADRDNEVFVSAASIWEIVLKHAVGKLALPTSPEEFTAALRAKSGIETLPITAPAVLQTAKLPLFHQDPFDRMLIAQAIEHSMILATPDPLIRQYAVRAIWD